MLFFGLFAFLMSVECAPRNFSELHHDTRITYAHLNEESIGKDTNGPNFQDGGVLTRPRRCFEKTVRIPYVISNNFFPRSLDLIHESLDDFQEETCLSFQEVEYNENETISFYDTNISIYFSTANYPGFACSNYHHEIDEDEGSFKTMIHLNEYSCMKDTRRIKQLIFGALGFIHENLRSDRDEYVTVLWDNIEPGEESKFRKVKEDVKNWVLPYDYLSISHHYSDYYSRDGKPTLISKNKKRPLKRTTELSPLDLLKIDTVFCKTDGNEITSHEKDIRDQFKIYPLYIPDNDDDSEVDKKTTTDPESGTETTTIQS